MITGGKAIRPLYVIQVTNARATVRRGVFSRTWMVIVQWDNDSMHSPCFEQYKTPQAAYGRARAINRTGNAKVLV